MSVCRHGRLGHGHERDRFSPLIVGGLKGLKVHQVQWVALRRVLHSGDAVRVSANARWRNAHQVACGDYHTLALLENGMVYSWGKGSEGRLGHGLPEEENQLQPKRIAALERYRVSTIACGYTTSAVATGTPHIPSHPIPSHPTSSHPIPSHPIPSHPTSSHLRLEL
jgi:hypothetical protein